MTTSLSAAELAHLVTAVPGVRGIEPGIGSTLRALGSHMRQQDPQQARFGVIVEEGSAKSIFTTPREERTRRFLRRILPEEYEPAALI